MVMSYVGCGSVGDDGSRTNLLLIEIQGAERLPFFDVVLSCLVLLTQSLRWWESLAEVAEGVDGGLVGGFDGGVEAEDGADGDGSAEGDGDNLPANEGVKRGDKGDEEGEAVAEGEAEEATENGKDERFEEELEEDVYTGGTDGFTDADFVGAFRDGDEHNIHDADAANDEGDTGDKSEHARDDGEERASRVGDLIAVGDGEVVIAEFSGREGLVDFFGGGGDGGSGGSADVNLLNLKIGIVKF